MLAIKLAYEYGQNVAGFSQSESNARIESLQKTIDDLTRQNEDLQRLNTKLVRDNEIEQGAGHEVTKELAKAQAQILEMREELTFYRNIVSPNSSERRVAIKKVQMIPDGDKRYKYKLILIQEGRHDVVVRGMVEVAFEGQTADGQTKAIALSSIALEKTPNQQRFGFKYFQNFEGGIRIPDDFVPMSMSVRVLPSTSSVPKLEEKFGWNDIISEENS
ncbi:MAG: hypothetical protein EP315_04765 [Gammaproteobacteria bacterium]|nr:MAG: hypothetical protein EP315_04765 [Gammaproteobacteria bacterium]